MKQASKGLASERCTPTQGECEEEEGGRAERALEGVLRFWVFGVLAGCVEPGTASCWSGWIQEDGRRSLGDTIPDTRATSKVRRGSFAEPFGAHCQTQEREGERARDSGVHGVRPRVLCNSSQCVLRLLSCTMVTELPASLLPFTHRQRCVGIHRAMPPYRRARKVRRMQPSNPSNCPEKLGAPERSACPPSAPSMCLSRHDHQPRSPCAH